MILLAFAGFNAKSDLGLEKSSEIIFDNDEALLNYIKKFGVAETIGRLSELENSQKKIGFCHNRAHQVGIFAYQIFGEDSFDKCTDTCGGGCYHGAIGSYGEKYGIENFESNLKNLCINSPIYDQCLHGLGHGLTAWANYDLKEALRLCNKITENERYQNECWRGVFMENIIGTERPHRANYDYLGEDAMYPCNGNVFEEKYLPACYQFSVFRIGGLFKNDWQIFARECRRVPAPFNRACFVSMGFNIGGEAEAKEELQQQCGILPEGEPVALCLSEALETFKKSGGKI